MASAGSGVGPLDLDYVLGITKAYSTRVGNGPFPTELHDAYGQHLSEKGFEFGATTGRKRRCGWFDAVLVRQSCAISGVTGIALTKLDVLDGFPEIKVCTAYGYKGATTKEMPYGLAEWRGAKPVYRTVKGWSKPTAGVRSLRKPREARDYVKILEDIVRCPFKLISTGAGREDTIEVGDPYVR